MIRYRTGQTSPLWSASLIYRWSHFKTFASCASNATQRKCSMTVEEVGGHNVYIASTISLDTEFENEPMPSLILRRGKKHLSTNSMVAVFNTISRNFLGEGRHRLYVVVL